MFRVSSDAYFTTHPSIKCFHPIFPNVFIQRIYPTYLPNVFTQRIYLFGSQGWDGKAKHHTKQIDELIEVYKKLSETLNSNQ